MFVYKKALQGTRQYEYEPKSVLVLEYYVIEKPLNSHESYYGIEIEQKKVKNGIDSTIECDRLILSEDKSWVEWIINKMIGYGVTITTMGSIVDDLITEKCLVR